ncbi:hypothetical protein ASPCADRAFT_206782 [Aspergillus carbonarius ITEM 5010]|uniref:Uncharacterized protein n=1 Tax=Aspergillus carbonarius (strain ITEM 5010) TaxID=602072 RepID=A0A1R3RQ41_ASPC5|nr:hypothetical protein ASPCADRAFT_206782 [Aspergillus carbonarius ITEM 5010]
MTLLEKPGFRISPVPATEEGARTIGDIEMAAQNDSNRKNNSTVGTLLWPPHLQSKVEAPHQSIGWTRRRDPSHDPNAR